MLLPNRNRLFHRTRVLLLEKHCFITLKLFLLRNEMIRWASHVSRGNLYTHNIKILHGNVFIRSLSDEISNSCLIVSDTAWPTHRSLPRDVRC